MAKKNNFLKNFQIFLEILIIAAVIVMVTATVEYNFPEVWNVGAIYFPLSDWVILIATAFMIGYVVERVKKVKNGT